MTTARPYIFSRGNVDPATRGSRLSLAKLFSLSPAEFEDVDIAAANLACAKGLPGTENLDFAACINTLERWTEAVRAFVAFHRSLFIRNPGEYKHQEGFFCFLSMVTLLKHPQKLNVSYQPTAVGNYDFSDSRDDFLYGPLTRRLGTCVSLPVLFVAIGRRLGWPMHLATAKRHVLVQWVNADGSHINLEGSCPGGGQTYPDERYHTKPGVLTREEIASGRYLRPLSDAESLALFLETRGHCLVDNRRFDEAHEAYAAAYRFAPTWSQFENHIYSLELHRATRRTAAKPRIAKQVKSDASVFDPLNLSIARSNPCTTQL